MIARHSTPAALWRSGSVRMTMSTLQPQLRHSAMKTVFHQGECLFDAPNVFGTDAPVFGGLDVER